MKKTFLAVGAHMDDYAFGAGGVLIQAARAGHRVVVVTVVSDYANWPNTSHRATQLKEDLVAAARKYGFEQRFLDYPYHQIDGGDVALKRKLAEIYVEVRPDVAFIHDSNDHWPDHVACAKACHDAFLFSHGLTASATLRRCPLIYAYALMPHHHTAVFQEDAYFDVGDVMKEYMELLLQMESCLGGRPPEQAIQGEFRLLGDEPVTLRLGDQGQLKLAECLIYGKKTGCRFASAFRTVWGKSAGRIGL